MDLIALSEEMSMAQITELFARKMCLDVQERLHSKLLPGETFHSNTLADPKMFAEYATNYTRDEWVGLGEFSEIVEETINMVAEEYTRDV